jgi:hypothetical protein
VKIEYWDVIKEQFVKSIFERETFMQWPFLERWIQRTTVQQTKQTRTRMWMKI